MPLRRYVTINGLKCLLGPALLPPSVRRLRGLGLRRPIPTYQWPTDSSDEASFSSPAEVSFGRIPAGSVYRSRLTFTAYGVRGTQGRLRCATNGVAFPPWHSLAT